VLLFAELLDTAGSSNDNVWGLEALEELLVVIDGLTTVDHASADVGHVLGEADELVVDLVSKLTGVAEDDSTSGFGVFGEVLQDCKHKYCSLSHSGHGLAKHINSENSFRNALLLHIGRMLETTVDNGLLDLRLEEHVLEGGGVHSDECCGLGSTSGLFLLAFANILFQDVVFVVR
jgi:hypothetical protein